MIYCTPYLSVRGTGFGNRLFTWARCRVFSEITGVTMLAPRWARMAVGPILRGGIDWRSYREQFLLAGIMRPESTYIRGLARQAILLRAKRLQEPHDWNFVPDEYRDGSGDQLVVFRGLQDYFRRLNGFNELLLKALIAATVPKLLRRVQSVDGCSIVMNVRCANDFRTPDPNSRVVRPAYKTPVSWFVEALQAIRNAVKREVAALIVTDGTEKDVAQLLQCPAVKILRPGCAISDLLACASAKVLLGSGSSSFAMWGAFLGRMPMGFIPGSGSGEWQMVPVGGQYIGEFDLERPAGFIEACRAALLTDQ